jgi:PIF1 helicase.
MQQSMQSIYEKKNYKNSRLLQIIQDEYRLNFEQKNVSDIILSLNNSNEGKIFSYAPVGGTGKTFLINKLLAKLRFDRKIVLAVASSGIVATLLEGGRTAHSIFKLPLKIYTDDVSCICNITKQSNAVNLMKDWSLQILG